MLLVCVFSMLTLDIVCEDSRPSREGRHKGPSCVARTNPRLLLYMITRLAYDIVGGYDGPLSKDMKIQYRMRIHTALGAFPLGITRYRYALQQASSEGTASRLGPHTLLWFVAIMGVLLCYSLYVLMFRRPY